jgi:hypothetical protein
VPGPRNLQSITVEYLVTGALDGTTHAPAIDLATTRFNQDSQIYEGGTVTDLGLIDPDFVTAGGSFGSRIITCLWIDTAAVGAAGAAVDVVGVRTDGVAELQKLVEDLVGDPGIFLDKGFLVAQGSEIRLSGFTAPAGEPIRVRVSICVPKDSADYALQIFADKFATPPPAHDPSAVHVNVAAEIDGIAVKAVPVDADIAVIEDSAAAWGKKKVELSTLPARNLQAVCDKGNVTDTAIGFGDNSPVPSTVGIWDWSTNGGTRVQLSYLGTNRLFITSGTIGLYFNTNGTQDIGAGNKRVRRAWINHTGVGVLQIGNASALLHDEEFVRITEPGAAATNTATLLAAVLGLKYIIEVTAGAGGQVDLATTGGDTINGAASPLTLAPGWYMVIAQSDADWRLTSF